MIVRKFFMKNSEKDTSLVKYAAGELSIVFSDNNKNLTDKENAVPRNAVNKGGIVKSDGQTFINKNELSTLLNTDKQGGNKIYNDLDDDEKFEDGNSKYAASSAIIKELSNRIQEPRTQLEREKLKESRDCINAFIDTPQLETERSIESDRIQKDLPKLTKKKMKTENIVCDQLTGEEFDNDAEGHHKERKSDNPRKALDPDNIIVTKKKNHQEIHKNGAGDRESLKNLALEKGWSTDNI